MVLSETAVVHPVKMVTGQNEDVIGAGLLDLQKLFAHSIGCALIPVSTARCLLRRQKLYPAGSEHIPGIGAINVAV